MKREVADTPVPASSSRQNNNHNTHNNNNNNNNATTSKPPPTLQMPIVGYLERRVGQNQFRWTPRRQRPKPPAPAQDETQQQATDPPPNTSPPTLPTLPPKQPQQQQPVLRYGTQEDNERENGWTAESETLYLRYKAQLFLDIFSMISTSPIHPSLLNEENVTRLLVGDSLPAALSFNIFVALCLGAAAAGDRDGESVFWMKARDYAGYLFDESDYHIAVALQRLCEYATNRGLLEQGQYYAIAGASVCEFLQRRSSVVYVWLLLRLEFDTQPQYIGKLRDAKQERLHRISISHHLQRKEGGDLDGTYQDLVLRLVLLYVEGSTELDGVVGTDEVLERLNEEWQLVSHLFTWGQRARFDVILNGYEGMVCWRKGKTDEAVRCATKVCRLAEEKFFDHLPLTRREAEVVLRVLAETGQRDELASFLERLRPRNGGTFLDGPLERFTQYL